MIGVLCIWLVITLLIGCSDVSVKRLAKADVDMVADIHRHETQQLLMELTRKLYARNPRELKKNSSVNVDRRLEQLFAQTKAPLYFPELNSAYGVEAMRLGLSIGYEGDRVFAVMAGLNEMLRESYGYKNDFYFLDNIEHQKLYNSARNIEVLVWLLRTSKDDSAQRLLLTDGTDSTAINLSFERLFGKLIACQDILAKVVADKKQRQINTVAHGVMSMVFVPI